LALRLESQRIPDAPCGIEGIEIAVSGKKMYLPLEVGARLDIRGRLHQTYALFYWKDLRKKHDLKRACILTQSASVPLETSTVWLSVDNRPTSTRDACHDREIEFCDGFPDPSFGLVMDIKILNDGEGYLEHVRRRFNPPLRGGEIFETERSISTFRDGTASYCTRENSNSNISECTAWRVFPNGPTLYMRGQRFGWLEERAVVSHEALSAAMDWLEAKLEPTGD
jgi:hypothetical protein